MGSALLGVELGRISFADSGIRTFIKWVNNASPEYLPDRRLFEVEWTALSELELLALILTPGSSDRAALAQAQRILDSLGSSRGLRSAKYQDLLRTGLDRTSVLSLLAAAHLFQRIWRKPLHPGQSFRCSRQVFEHFQIQFQDLKKECFWAILLDGKNRILKLVRISEGTLTSSLVHPREVFRPAIEEATSGVLVVHNHPSGDPAPSDEDRRITKRLVETGKVVGIRILDHVIIASDSYFSFADQSLL